MEMSTYRQAAFALIVACSTGCGALHTPDLGHGAVTGSIAGARAGQAYAYVLGSPEILAWAATDGTFRLDRVPVGQAVIVLFDGDRGAETVPLRVDAASESHVDLGRPLEPAGAILASASPLGGHRATGLTFTVEGTPLQSVRGEGGAYLFPLPAGTFTVRLEEPGYSARSVSASIDAGTSNELALDLDVNEQDQHPGCLSSGCENGLVCAPTDGRCYACVSNADCSGGTCDPTGHRCMYGGGAGPVCAACTVAANCSAGPAGETAVCAPVAAGPGYCTHACGGPQDCPSGYDCQQNACFPLMGCQGIATAYGGTCFGDDVCKAALRNGKCMPADRPDNVAGTCSAPIQAGCPAGYQPDPGGNGYCVKTS
jgi:hypothetical protein